LTGTAARGRLGAAALGRSAAAGAGALVGGLIAVPTAGRLGLYLFETLGTRIIDGVLTSALDDVSGISAFFVAAFALVFGVTLAALVVLALVAPLFVVLPIVVTAVTLRLTGAGLILPTVAWTLVWGGGFAVAAWAVAALADHRLDGWSVIPAVALAASLGRVTVELWRPERAGVPDEGVLGRRWRRVALSWLLVLVIATVAAVGFVLLTARAFGT